LFALFFFFFNPVLNYVPCGRFEAERIQALKVVLQWLSTGPLLVPRYLMATLAEVVEVADEPFR
jgi:hypothetical protein